MVERGVSEEEVKMTVEGGEPLPAKVGRRAFRRNFSYGQEWRGRTYANKQVEVIAVDEEGWLVITVMARYF